MPLNPLTGQVDYGGASYDPNNMNAGMAMRAAARAEVETPFFFELSEQLPGVVSTALFNSRRYANTLQKGGRFDVGAGAQGRKLARAQKYSAMVGKNAAPTSAASFPTGGRGILGRYARNKVAKGKNAFFNPARANNLSVRSLNRFHSLRTLAGDPSIGYTPFQAFPSAFNALASKSQRFRTRFGISDTFDPTKDKAYSGGVLGRITSLNKLNQFENIIAKGPGSSRFSLARYNRASAARNTMIQNIAKVTNVANPAASPFANTQHIRLQAQLARSHAARTTGAAHRALRIW